MKTTHQTIMHVTNIHCVSELRQKMAALYNNGLIELSVRKVKVPENRHTGKTKNKNPNWAYLTIVLEDTVSIARVFWVLTCGSFVF